MNNRLIYLVVSLVLFCQLPACTTSLKSQRQALHPAIEIRKPDNNFGNPKLSPPEIMSRVLKLIDHTHTREDLSEESVQNVLGLHMYLSDQTTNRTITFSQIINSEWGWSVDNYSLDGHRIFAFDFVHPGMITEMTTVCQMDLDQFHNSLLQMAYQQRSSWAARTSI